jgi:MFS superfamily sulfate permease-like transporter
VLTAATVVLLGVEQGIVLAIVASVIGHLRRSYKTATAVMIPDENDNGLHSTPFDPSARTAPGVAVYRFASDLFYVNANLFLEDLTALANSTEPLRLIILDSGAITDIDFTGSLTIKQVLTELSEHNVKLVFADAMTSVRHKLDRYDITQLVGDDAFYPTVGSALRAVATNDKGGHQFPDDRP